VKSADTVGKLLRTSETLALPTLPPRIAVFMNSPTVSYLGSILGDAGMGTSRERRGYQQTFEMALTHLDLV